MKTCFCGADAPYMVRVYAPGAQLPHREWFCRDHALDAKDAVAGAAMRWVMVGGEVREMVVEDRSDVQPGVWYCELLGSITEGYHVFTTESAATEAAIRWIADEREQLAAQALTLDKKSQALTQHSPDPDPSFTSTWITAAAANGIRAHPAVRAIARLTRDGSYIAVHTATGRVYDVTLLVKRIDGDPEEHVD